MNRKQIYNIIIKISIILVFILIIAWGYQQLNTREKSVNINLYTLVPQDCYAIVETNDIATWIHHVKGAQFSDALQEIYSFPILRKIIPHIERQLKSRNHNSENRINRLVISFHQQGENYEPILYGTLPSNDLSSFENIFKLEQTHLSPKEITYKEETITILPLGRDFIACYFQPGFFIMSQQIKLIQQAIDSYKENKSVINIPHFNEMIQKRQVGNHPLTLFLHNQSIDSISKNNQLPLAHWQRYNIRINNESIYLTGECCDSEEEQTIACIVKDEQKREPIPAEELPKQVKQFYQIPFLADRTTHQPTDKDSSILLRNNNLKDLLLLYSSRQMEIIDFYPTNSPHSETIIRVPLVDNISEVDKYIKKTRLAKRMPSIWTQTKGYPVWMIHSSNLLYPYLKSTDENKYFLTISDKQFIFGTELNTIREYLFETTDTLTRASVSRPSENHDYYKYCLNDLAEEANFTLIADLSLLLDNTILEEKATIVLPSFILKQANFFKNFMLSIQLIHTHEETSTNIIFNYKGAK